MFHGEKEHFGAVDLQKMNTEPQSFTGSYKQSVEPLEELQETHNINS